jgi:shikimate dehydrogenase
MIRGTTTLIAHIGYPTESFKAPMIYNPYFEQQGIDAVVMPMGVKAGDYPGVLASVRKLTNLRGALITMPHKVTTVDLVDEVTPTARIAGACNAILLRPDGSLLGDMFDGAGFVRGVQRKGLRLEGSSALVVGCGGVGSAIARARSSSAVAASVRRSPHRWPRQPLRRSDCTTRRRAPPTVSPIGCASTIRRSTCGRAPTILPAMRWS